MGKIVLYHNTINSNAIEINKSGLKGGTRLNAYGKGNEAESSGIWCRTNRTYGNGGATITFEIDENDPDIYIANDNERIVYRDIKPEEIIDIDLVVAAIPSVDRGNKEDNFHTTTMESEIPKAIEFFGKDKVINVLCSDNGRYLAEPYNKEQLQYLIQTGNKYCRGTIKLDESKEVNDFIRNERDKLSVLKPNENKYTRAVEHKMNKTRFDNERNQLKKKQDFYRGTLSKNIQELTESKQKIEEASRNELLALTKGETISRYNKAEGYKNFQIENIDTTNVLRNNSLVVTCRVGDYNDTVELDDILYWVQISAENTSHVKNQINTKVVTQAIMNSIDGKDIKVDCTCADWKYRFAYAATQLGYKYGRQENRPNKYKKTNKDNVGALCKHLTSMLSNKRWLQKVTSTFMDWIEKNIDDVNGYLGLTGDKELVLPNSQARQSAKSRWQRRDINTEPTEIDKQEPTNTSVERPSNVQGNNPSTNRTFNRKPRRVQTNTEMDDVMNDVVNDIRN